VNPKDQISLFRVLNIDSLEIVPLVISDHLASAKFERRNLWEVIQDSKDAKMLNFLALVREYQAKVAKTPPVSLVYEIVNKKENSGDRNYFQHLFQHEIVFVKQLPNLYKVLEGWF